MYSFSRAVCSVFSFSSPAPPFGVDELDSASLITSFPSSTISSIFALSALVLNTVGALGVANGFAPPKLNPVPLPAVLGAPPNPNATLPAVFPNPKPLVAAPKAKVGAKAAPAPNLGMRGEVLTFAGAGEEAGVDAPNENDGAEGVVKTGVVVVVVIDEIVGGVEGEKVGVGLEAKEGGLGVEEIEPSFAIFPKLAPNEKGFLTTSIESIILESGASEEGVEGGETFCPNRRGEGAAGALMSLAALGDTFVVVNVGVSDAIEATTSPLLTSAFFEEGKVGMKDPGGGVVEAGAALGDVDVTTLPPHESVAGGTGNVRAGIGELTEGAGAGGVKLLKAGTGGVGVEDGIDISVSLTTISLTLICATLFDVSTTDSFLRSSDL